MQNYPETDKIIVSFLGENLKGVEHDLTPVQYLKAFSQYIVPCVLCVFENVLVVV